MRTVTPCGVCPPWRSGSSRRLARANRIHRPRSHIQQRLQHCQGDQFRVAELRLDAYGRPFRGRVRGFLQQVVGSHVQCGSEGVQFCRHKRILDALALSAQVIPWNKSSGRLDSSGRLGWSAGQSVNYDGGSAGRGTHHGQRPL